MTDAQIQGSRHTVLDTYAEPKAGGVHGRTLDWAALHRAKAGDELLNQQFGCGLDECYIVALVVYADDVGVVVRWSTTPVFDNGPEKEQVLIAYAF